MAKLKFEAPRKLCSSDEVLGFSCGVDIVDCWVQSHALQAKKHGSAVVYASFCDGRLAGLYSLSAKSVSRANVSNRWLKSNAPQEIPVILLGMLGVDIRFQGMGLGKQLLLDAVHRSIAAADIVGAKALFVEPAIEQAANFYKKYGFQKIPATSYMYAKITNL